MIPKTEWAWSNEPIYFPFADECKFRTATRIGRYIVCTFGAYYPTGFGISFNPGDVSSNGAKYSTAVLLADNSAEKNSFVWDVIRPRLEVFYYMTESAARKGHDELCLKYAEMQSDVLLNTDAGSHQETARISELAEATMQWYRAKHARNNALWNPSTPDLEYRELLITERARERRLINLCREWEVQNQSSDGRPPSDSSVPLRGQNVYETLSGGEG